MFLMRTGSKFQAAGPATVNELLAKRVLVRLTTKSPRIDNRRRLSLQRLHRSVRYKSDALASTSIRIQVARPEAVCWCKCGLTADRDFCVRSQLLSASDRRWTVDGRAKSGAHRSVQLLSLSSHCEHWRHAKSFVSLSAATPARK